MMANLVFKNLSEPFPVAQVRIFEGGAESILYAITGWRLDERSPLTEAMAVQVEDSGSGAAWLIYGGDAGLRLRPAGSESEWSLSDPEQFGETHLVLGDAEDIIGV